MNNCYIKPLLPTREHLNTQALVQTLSALFLSAQTKWAIPEKKQTGMGEDWGYGISRGIKEIAYGISDS